uniref:basic salivary proline-rich protein 1-like n=1 Tax=Odobenus rosmarus divergens TaxID=9708 RepID=UPI00063C9557|nr:PREDICTED: basic salivary proline-rich protein 1-like [Odobenus rosmarus divergens]
MVARGARTERGARPPGPPCSAPPAGSGAHRGLGRAGAALPPALRCSPREAAHPGGYCAQGGAGRGREPGCSESLPAPFGLRREGQREARGLGAGAWVGTKISVQGKRWGFPRPGPPFRLIPLRLQATLSGVGKKRVESLTVRARPRRGAPLQPPGLLAEAHVPSFPPRTEVPWLQGGRRSLRFLQTPRRTLPPLPPPALGLQQPCGRRSAWPGVGTGRDLHQAGIRTPGIPGGAGRLPAEPPRNGLRRPTGRQGLEAGPWVPRSVGETLGETLPTLLSAGERPPGRPLQLRAATRAVGPELGPGTREPAGPPQEGREAGRRPLAPRCALARPPPPPPRPGGSERPAARRAQDGRDRKSGPQRK